MIMRGNRHFNCPRCGTDLICDYNEVDFVHACVNSDGTRKTSWEPEDNPFTNTDEMENRGINPEPKVRKWSDIKKAIRRETNVDTYIKF